jgi:hypothetical protein
VEHHDHGSADSGVQPDHPYVILHAEQRWVCPNCPATAVTEGQTNRFHRCTGLRLLLAPMVLEGTRCKVVAREREDYVGRETVQCDGEGRPVAAIMTVRDDGEDCTVLAPAARMRMVSDGVER